MKKVISAWVLAIVIIASLLFGFNQITPPKLIRDSRSTSGFSLDGALHHIEKIAYAPHPAGSVQNTQVRDYIVQCLKGMGLDVTVQKATMERRGKTYGLENIFAKMEGSDKDGINLMLTAHYDSTPNGPGAADDGAGVAAVLEAVRVVKGEGPPKNNIYILISDGEEVGLLGAMAFANANQDIMKSIDFDINFEARGNKGPVIMFESSDKNLGLIGAFGKVTPNPIGFSFSQDIYKRMPNVTDFTVFKEKNIKGMNFAALDGFNTYHTKKDTVENLDRESLQQYGLIAENVARYFGSITKNEFNKSIAQGDSDAVYFPFFKGNLIVYPQGVVILVTAVTLLAFLVIIAIGVKRKVMGIKNILLGSLSSLGIMVAVSLISLPIVILIVRVYGLRMRGITVASFKYSDSYALLISALSLLVIYLACHMVSKKIKHIELACGGLVIWAVMLLLTSVYLKGTSYIFEWPLLAFIILVAYKVLQGMGKGRILAETILLSVTSFITIMIFLPVIYMVYIAMTIGIMPVLSFLLAVLAVCLLPLVMQAFNNRKEGFGIGIDMGAGA